MLSVTLLVIVCMLQLMATFSSLNDSGKGYRFDTIDKVPKIFYGTAWKKERTAELVEQAVTNGFRAIDTACQPKHYSESGVGDGLLRAYEKGIVTRQDIFLQTKFTPLPGQDPARVPYDASAPVQNQVRQSFDVSLTNLHTDYIDSLVLHSPMGMLEETLSVWRVFEELYAAGRVRYLGISNMYSLEALIQLYSHAVIKPTFVQNRFYKKSGFDVGIREFCLAHGMKYQSFWTLTATPSFLHSDPVLRTAEKYHRTPEQVMFQYMHHIGAIPLSGTKSVAHMRQDVDIFRPPVVEAAAVTSSVGGGGSTSSTNGGLQVTFTAEEVASMTDFLMHYAANTSN